MNTKTDSSDSSECNGLVMRHSFGVRDHVFCRRVRDGKYLRGARFYRWTKSWRRAAVLSVGMWGVFIWRINEPVEFVGLNDINA